MEKEDSKTVAATDDKPITIIDQVFVTEVGDEPEDFPTTTDYYDMETQLQKEYEVALMHELKGINIQSYQNEELTRRVQYLLEVVCQMFYITPQLIQRTLSVFVGVVTLRYHCYTMCCVVLIRQVQAEFFDYHSANNETSAIRFMLALCVP